MPQSRAIASAETVAILRAIAAGETELVTPCEDQYAQLFLGPVKRLAVRVLPHALLRGLFDRVAPGSYCFTIARTRHFDEALLAGSRTGLEQLVILGAGYDSRAFRYGRELSSTSVLEVDHPGTQSRKERILRAGPYAVPINLRFIPLDFTTGALEQALVDNGFAFERTTLFLWEGVSYYLPEKAVRAVLDLVARCKTGSSIMFDYAIRSFVEGDVSTYGGEQVARWLRRIGEPFLFGLNAHEVPQFLQTCNLRLTSDVGPHDLQAMYLGTANGGSLGPPLGHVRIAHAASREQTAPLKA
jgi:methyltransferase (TIGR00027 family)